MGSLWNRSGTVERYADDLRASGAKAYFFVGDTTTKLTVFRDSSEASAYPHPLTADANGRWPDVFVPYIASYDVRVTSEDDVQLTFSLKIPNPNPVDITTVAPAQQLVTTGMVHCEFINAPKAGYVRLNGRTIGDDISNASELNSTALARDLFLYLWNNVNDPFCPVTPGGRGATAEADFGAHKQLGLPDMRGYTFCGLATMGNSVSDILPPPINWTLGDGTLTASSIGGSLMALSAHHLPLHTHKGSVDTSTTLGAVAHGHTLSGETAGPDRDHSHALSGTFTSSSNPITHHHNVPDLQINAPNSFGSGGGTAINSIVYGNADGPSTTDDTSVPHSHTIVLDGSNTGSASQIHRHQFSPAVGSTVVADSTTQNLNHAHTFTTGTGAPDLQGLPFMNMQPTRTVTWFIKL